MRTLLLTAILALGCMAPASVHAQECDNPIQVTEGETVIDVSDVGSGRSDCFAGLLAYLNYQASESGAVNVTYCSAGTPGMQGIEVWLGCECPASLNEPIGCSITDVPDPKCAQNLPEVEFPVEAGQCYTIVVGHEMPTTHGTLSVIPLVTGACCFPDGGCATATAALCTALGGTFQGAFVSCSDVDCPTPCPADINGSGAVDLSDLLNLLGTWGNCPSPDGADDCPTDLDMDGQVGSSDLLIMLAAWGPC